MILDVNDGFSTLLSLMSPTYYPYRFSFVKVVISKGNFSSKHSRRPEHPMGSSKLFSIKKFTLMSHAGVFKCQTSLFLLLLFSGKIT